MNNPLIPLFDRLEVMDDTQPHEGTLNMALDEVLLVNVGLTPLLRIYRWSKPAVSFGYFEPCKPVMLSHPEHEPVRRWTGGGVVRHEHDVTYSLLVPRLHPMMNLPAGESYRLIHEALRLGLHALGSAPISLVQQDLKNQQVGSQVCFEMPVRHDLVSGERKIQRSRTAPDAPGTATSRKHSGRRVVKCHTGPRR